MYTLEKKCIFLQNCLIEKDREMRLLKRKNAELNQDNQRMVIENKSGESYYEEKIRNLEEQLNTANETCMNCIRNHSQHDDLEIKLSECTQAKAKLEKQSKELNVAFNESLDVIRVLKETVETLDVEKRLLINQIEDLQALFPKMDQLRVEKHQLQKEVMNVRALISHKDHISADTTRRNMKSLQEELPQAFFQSRVASTSCSELLVPAEATALESEKTDGPEESNEVGTQTDGQPRSANSSIESDADDTPGAAVSSTQTLLPTETLKTPYESKQSSSFYSRIPEDCFTTLKNQLINVLTKSFYFIILLVCSLFIVLKFASVTVDVTSVARFLQSNVQVQHRGVAPH